jgi:FkbM family methyltransferase
MPTIELRSPRGNPATLYYREDTSDLSTLGSTWELWGKLEDEYGLGALPDLTGTAIDIGAHIGSVAFALLADHPGLRVTAVEPLAGNCAVMEDTAVENGWTDRLDIIHGAIAPGKTADVAWDFRGDENLRNHRYIGGVTFGVAADHDTETVPSVTLSSIIGDGAPFLKVDCEGCEWDLLSDKAIRKVERIVGEGHPADWLKRVHAALDKTHEVTVLTDFGGPGTFQAVRR